ncbi:MAG TPA: FG-GAP-like repeat-containing protein [Planctomycetota bacterium]|jgi:hypothetical protein|nr:FG-GAP-like repeat-containing protein [Planctomycetota bacterium]
MRTRFPDSPRPARFSRSTLWVWCFVGLGVLGQASRGQSVLWEVQDTLWGTSFGNRVRSVDFDGDGVLDLVVGAPAYAPPTVPNGGRVQVISGATQAVLLEIPGTWPDGWLGSSIGKPGDMDGDGIVDFVFLIPYFFQGPATRAIHAEAYSGTGLLAGTQLFVDSAGAGGDYDGDGIGDLLIGRRPAQGPGCTGASGQVLAVSGMAGPVVAQWYPQFPCGIAYMGTALEPAGDISGDGLPDFVVTSSGTPALSPPPAVRVYSGIGALPVWTTSGVGLYGTEGALALVGDANGDGIEDIVVGSAYENRVTLLSGSNGAILQVVILALTPCCFGRAVGRIGDLDGDGLNDFLVGSPVTIGSVWPPGVWPGGLISPGHAYVYSGDPSVGLLLDLVEPPPGEGFGSAVAEMGELDGDGYPEFAVSEPWRVSPDPGRVVVHSGAPVGVSVFGSACPGTGGFAPRAAVWPTPTGSGPVSVQPGGVVRFNLSRALGGAPAVLLLGTSNVTWAGTPLPLPLGSLGMPSCSLLVSPDVQVPVVTQGTGPGLGRASVSLTVPSVPGLSGSVFYLQWYVVDPGPALAPGAASRGVEVIIQ